MSTKLARNETAKHLKHCIHCGLEIPLARLTTPDRASQFCCAGCQTVYQAIHKYGLTHFYDLKRQLAANELQPSTSSGSSFSYLDDETCVTNYVQKQADAVWKVRFYLEGVHCAACVWLIEKLPQIIPGVHEARVSFGTSTVVVTYDPSAVKLSTIAHGLDAFGYRPHPVRADEHAELARKENQTLLIRIGIAAACAGNTMLIAVSLYQGLFSGIDVEHRLFFQWLSLVISLPAVLYSAIPFYTTSIGGLRAKRLHIDLPISIGIIAGFAISAWNTLTGAEHVYFDSICMLIFLLLVGRWFQKSAVKRSLDSRDLRASVAPLSAIRVSGENHEEVYAPSLRPGDIVLIEPMTLLAADGIVRTGKSSIDKAILTGESIPAEVMPGDIAYAGTKNLAYPLELEVTHAFHDSRIGNLIQTIEDGSREESKLISITDKLSGYFVAAILVLAAATFLAWYASTGLAAGASAALTLLIISCPCALGLSAPLAIGVGLRRAARVGILFRKGGIIEELVNVKQVFFDKTGTLTQGSMHVVSAFHASAEVNEQQVLSAAKGLEQGSRHPVGTALFNYADSADRLAVKSVTTVEGKGVLGKTENDREWSIGSLAWFEERGLLVPKELSREISALLVKQQTPILVSAAGTVVSLFAIADALKHEIDKTVQYYKSQALDLYILSGDHPGIVEAIARELSIPRMSAYGNLTPEDKRKFVKTASQHQQTMMIGDGANDAAALSAADIGVAVRGGAELSLRTADVFVTRDNALALVSLIEGAKRVVRVVKLNLAFSLLYNAVGVTAAVLGLITPLTAAVLMPLSSLTVILSSMTIPTFREHVAREKWI